MYPPKFTDRLFLLLLLNSIVSNGHNNWNMKKKPFSLRIHFTVMLLQFKYHS